MLARFFAFLPFSVTRAESIYPMLVTYVEKVNAAVSAGWNFLLCYYPGVQFGWGK